MVAIDMYTISDRQEAGKLLGLKLKEHRTSDAVIIGISTGGLVVAASIAKLLSLPLEVFPCRRIADPTDNTRSIGSVSLDSVVVQNNRRDTPQDYISHQIALLRAVLRSEWQSYFSNNPSIPLFNKTAIVVDDISMASDSLITCVTSIMKQKPAKVIIAVPIISEEAARQIGGLADEVVFVRMSNEVQSAEEFYIEYPTVEVDEVKALLRIQKREIEV